MILLVREFLLPHFLTLSCLVVKDLGHHCGAEIRKQLTLSIAKKFRPLSSDSLKWRKPSDEL